MKPGYIYIIQFETCAGDQNIHQIFYDLEAAEKELEHLKLTTKDCETCGDRKRYYWLQKEPII